MAEKPLLSAEYHPILAALAEVPPIAVRAVNEARAMWDANILGEPEQLFSISDLSVPGARGKLLARIYVPSSNPLGVILFIHGGGWVLGSLATHDIAVRALAARSGCAILAIEYGLTPEVPFPGGLEDCYAALEWLATNRAMLGLGDKPLLVCGDSAGGNLGAALAILARDRDGPHIAGQILIYPVTDGRRGTASYREHATGSLLTALDMEWFWGHYAPGDLALDPLASVCLQPSLADLPPAVVVVGEYDPLRDEALAYSRQLRAAGVACEDLFYADLPHGFITFYPVSPGAERALCDIAKAIKSILERISQ